MTSNVTPFELKIKALLSRKSFNGGRNSAKALATLAAAARSLVREITLKPVTFDVIHVTEVDVRDLNSTRLPSILARISYPGEGSLGMRLIKPHINTYGCSLGSFGCYRVYRVQDMTVKDVEWCLLVCLAIW